jgi:hypothetical protein
MKAECCTCKFNGDVFKGGLYRYRDNMECRRHAPVYDIRDHFKPRWPLISGTDFCGDYEYDTTLRSEDTQG